MISSYKLYKLSKLPELGTIVQNIFKIENNIIILKIIDVKLQHILRIFLIFGGFSGSIYL